MRIICKDIFTKNFEFSKLNFIKFILFYRCPHCAPDCIISRVVSLHTVEFHLMLHGENLYHCQYCKYIDFNRDEMRTHMRKSHLLELTTNNQSNIIVIRQTMLEDDKIERNKCQGIYFTRLQI